MNLGKRNEHSVDDTMPRSALAVACLSVAAQAQLNNNIALSQSTEYWSENATVNLLASFSFNASDGTPGCAWRRWLEGDWDWDRQDPECISPLCSCNINFEYEPGMYNASFRLRRDGSVIYETSTVVTIVAPFQDVQHFPTNRTNLRSGVVVSLEAMVQPPPRDSAQPPVWGPSETTGQVNYSWAFSDNNGTIIVPDLPSIGHNFAQSGVPIVTVIATNARGSITSSVEYSVFDPVLAVDIIAGSSDLAPYENFNAVVQSNNATNFRWEIQDADISEECYCRNLTLSFNTTGYHNITVTGENPVSGFTATVYVQVTPAPTPPDYARIAEISTPIVVLSVVVGVAVTSFVSHRWYMNRKGVETADFDFSMGVNTRQPRRRSMMQNLKQSILSMRTKKSNRGGYGSLNDDL